MTADATTEQGPADRDTRADPSGQIGEDSGVRQRMDWPWLPAGYQLSARRYQIVDMLDHGSTAQVYRARMNRLAREVAIKMFSRAYVQASGGLAWIDAEAASLSAIDHPNVVRILDRDAHEDQPYLVLELLAGENLDGLIETLGPLPEPQAIAIAMDMLAGLGAMHAHGLVHRDAKPHNVVVIPAITDDGRPSARAKLCDLGLARGFDTAGSDPATDAEFVCGTPEYMSPEQASGLPLDGRSDIYSVGIALYHMLVGRPPFRGGDAQDIAVMQVDEPLPEPRLARPDISEAVEAVILQATSKEPECRFATAGDMRRALRDAIRLALSRSSLTRGEPEAHGGPAPASCDGLAARRDPQAHSHPAADPAPAPAVAWANPTEQHPERIARGRTQRLPRQKKAKRRRSWFAPKGSALRLF